MTTHKKNASPMSDVSVSTDQQDYAPGSTATITASGFAAGSTITFQVQHVTDAGPDGIWGTPDDVIEITSGAGHDPWSVTDGGPGDLDGEVNGSVTTSWYVNPDDSAGATFLLTAASGDLTATASFTDSPLIETTGVTVTVDETTGLQNHTATPTPAGDDDDNDALLALPTAFATRLTALQAGTVTGEALSGYTGAAGNTGSNAFTINAAAGGTIQDVSFTDVNGAALDGVDSGLLTLDGAHIYLYTDSTDNNVLLGRVGDANGADENGAIVFAAYIEQVPPTPQQPSGGKIWIVEYQPLQHPDATDPDDALDLSDIVFIGTSQDLTFSLANAPSGQNLFLMFTTANPQTFTDANNVVRISGPTIIATGKDPADQSAGLNITTGDTINTSQAGGPTTFGTNNQMIVEQEGIRFTFVTGARQDVTIPNLDQNEADLESNIDFSAMFGARTASFDVVQLQSGKSAVVKISAFSTAAETGVNFINGYAGDAPVTISNVKVINISTGATVTDPSLVININGGVATITGVLAGYRIEYTTSQDHNRVLIENGAAVDAKGNNHADFDIGGFKLLQVSTATAEIGSKMIFEDDGPSISASQATVPTLTTDDTDIPDTAGPTSFANLFTAAFGQDGFKDADHNHVQDADAITYALGVSASGGVDSGLVDTLSGDKIYLFLESGSVVGRVGTAGGLADPAGAIALTISVAANTGAVTLVQSHSVVHNDPTDPVESGASAAGLAAANLVTLTATATDGDGDTASATRNIGNAFKFEDDGPTISGNQTAAPTLTTDDTDIPDTAGPTSFAGLFDSNFGKDGFKDANDNNVQDGDAITYALGVSAPGGVDSGLVDTLSGDKIYLFLESGSVVGRVGTAGGLADPAGAIALTISVGANTGAVTLVQSHSVVHNDPTDPVESGASAAGLAAANLVTLTATITDGDGDTASATRNIGNAFKFEDDGPSISGNQTAAPTLTTDDTDIPDTAGPTSFAGLFNAPVFGNDGFKDSNDDNVQDADAVVYTLGVSASGGVDSGLVDTLSGDKIYLFLESGSVVGRVGTAGGLADPAGAIALTISVGANTGAVTLVQSHSVVHNDPTDPVESGASAAGLAAANLVTLTATITDGDGDTASATRNIGNAFKFEDDGPSISGNQTAAPTLTTDDTDIPDTAGPTSFAGLFNAPVFGNDGFKDSNDDNVQDADAVVYTLGVSASGGVDSGLVDTLSGDKIYLFLESGSVVGRVGTAGGLADPLGATALTISVNASTGAVTLVQSHSVVHNDPTDPVESGASAATLAAANLVTLTATVTDGDGDTASATRNIGDAFKFEDDGPSISANQTAAPTLTTDDTDIPDTAGPTSFAGLFDSNFGKDGFKDTDDNNVQDANAITYALGVSASGGVDSGLVDTLSGDKIFLFLESGSVVGRVGTAGGLADAAGAIALTISVAANTGAVTLVQSHSVVHNDPTDPVESGASAAGLAAANLVTLTATITDGDGDTASATRNIGTAFKFEDDGPTISGNQTAVPPMVTDDTDIPDTAGPTSFAGLFDSNFGKDGFKDANDNDVQDGDAITYALGVSATGGVDSGLVDTLSGDKIFLFLESGSVVGRVGTAGGLADAAGAIALTISVVANTGAVTLVQSHSVVHNDPTDPVESGASAAGLAAANLVTLTATITDGDGDTASATRNIGAAFKFEDDGPSISGNQTAAPTLTTDDTDIPDTAGPTSFAGLFDSNFGKDGFKDANDDNVQDADAITYALGVSAPGGVDSGLVDSLTGNKIFLFLQGGSVLGRVGTAGGLADAAGAIALTISVAANTGAVTLVQSHSVMHNDPTDPVENGASAATLAAANLVTLTATITDGDGDTASATRNIGSAFTFEDDGPSLAFGNLVGTGSILPQTGYWDHSFGTDGMGTAGLDISLTGFTLVRPGGATTTGSGTLTEQSPSPDGNGAFHFSGTLTGDFDNNASTANTSVDYTLTAFADGSYALDLVQGFSSTLVLSSANGSLDAGGPDPVRTLTIGTEQIVFFNAVPTAPQIGTPPNPDPDPASILSGVGIGAPDPTEAQLQTNPLPSYIGTGALNVSTSGIGINNNNLDGNTTAGINTGDESFVINPKTLLTGMKVYIDNSVGGYDPASEELYFTIYYDNGTTSGAPTKVLASDLHTEAGGQKSFTVNWDGTHLIDAVQLTMGKGTVKIPVIEFIKQTENLASDVQLSFNATVTDKDGDTSTSAFTANLFANKAAGSTFDYQLVGVTGARDAFNVDLSRPENKYQVTGFDVTAGHHDAIVLNGDPASTFSINNNTNDSIVTVNESGGQVTTITVVGVDLLNTDIVHGAV
ncbi:DUF5801 repeats-in-toxin domain-containing protein [Pseudomonas nitroreducens]|uniref:DUF5801 repeats-in-toxin domain-containing protein n=1 Tax=Pseudomonas nitroreducens TaxID=46680 RepID=UPI002F3567B0